jgi:hypothetical protein
MGLTARAYASGLGSDLRAGRRTESEGLSRRDWSHRRSIGSRSRRRHADAEHQQRLDRHGYAADVSPRRNEAVFVACEVLAPHPQEKSRRRPHLAAFSFECATIDPRPSQIACRRCCSVHPLSHRRQTRRSSTVFGAVGGPGRTRTCNQTVMSGGNIGNIAKNSVLSEMFTSVR